MEAIYESFVKRSITESLAAQSRYADYISAVEKSKAGEGKSFDSIQKGYLATMLENVDRELSRRTKGRIDEATEASDIGDFRRFAFPIISAVYPSLIANELVSVQPLKLKTGQVFYLDVVAGSNVAGKGGAGKSLTGEGYYKEGDIMFSSDGAGKRAKYSYQAVENEQYSDLDETKTIALGFELIVPGTVAGAFIGEDDAAPANAFTDDGKGNLVEGTTIVGTVDYKTGTLTFTNQTAGTPELSFEYAENENSAYAGGIPQVDVTIKEITLKARSQKLRSLYSFDAAYDLQMSQGVNIDDVLMEACGSQLKFELDGMIINDLYKGAGNKSTWSKNFRGADGVAHISQHDHWSTFIDEINACRNKIFNTTKRVAGNWVVVGTEAATIIEHFQGTRFKSAETTNVAGPHFAGTIDGVTKVFKDPYMNPNAYLVGYKGSQWIDAGYVLGVYLPLYATNLIMLDDFVGRRGYATSNARRLLKPSYYVAGMITEA